MAWYIGQSLLMMAIAFAVGLLVGYLIFGRRYRRLEAAEAVRAVDPATVLPHRGSTAPATPAPATSAAPVPAPVAVVDAGAEVEVEVEDLDHGDVDVQTFDVADDDVADDEDQLAALRAAEDETPAEPAVEPEPEIDAGIDTEIDTEPAEAGLAVEVGDDEPPTAAEIAAEAEPQSLFAAAGEPEPVAVPVAAAAPVAGAQSDRLEQIEGIGPKIALALRTAGIRTFEQLAGTDETTLRNALADANLRFAPSLATWAAQARLLADGDHEGHAALTEQLVAGRAPKAN